MLLGINVFEFSRTRDLYLNTNAAYDKYIPVFEAGYVPCLALLTSERVATVNAFIRNNKNDAITYTSGAIATSDASDYKLIKILKTANATMVEGTYYYEIVVNGVSYYSTPFHIRESVSNLFKVSVDVDILTIANGYPYDLSGITYDAYIQWDGIENDINVIEKGVEKPYGDIPVFSTVNFLWIATLNANNAVLKFIAALRVFQVNGGVEVSYINVNKNIYNSSVEIHESDTFGTTMKLKFTFSEVDFLSVRNEI